MRMGGAKMTRRNLTDLLPVRIAQLGRDAPVVINSQETPPANRSFVCVPFGPLHMPFGYSTHLWAGQLAGKRKVYVDLVFAHGNQQVPNDVIAALGSELKQIFPEFPLVFDFHFWKKLGC